MNDYGYVWAPRVDAGWMPYQSGYWYTDYPYGPTWVSSEPWGYAPYHYGRWAFVGDRWYWVPDRSNVTPVYSPALVSFVPFGQNEIGWVPLGPGDVYVPHYYDNSWQPYYLTRDNLYYRSVNLGVPGAVSVVTFDEFTRGMDWRRARKADKNMLASVNPVLDPLLLTPLRNAVVNSAWGRGKKDIPPGIAKKLDDTTVITSRAPNAPPFRRDIAKSMRVETVSDRAKGQKFKVRDERQGQGKGAGQQTSQAPVQAPQQQPREAKRVEQEQRKQEQQQQRVERRVEAPKAERAARPARQQAQGERVAAPQPRQQQQPRREVKPQQQPQMRRDPGPVRSTQPAPRAQPQQQQRQERPARQQQPKQERPAKAQPPKGGKGPGKKP